jgi:BirA family transcriptional regulator, biotin operon repressor / biotin---[acetyl-CoA-carboxylase] ligase
MTSSLLAPVVRLDEVDSTQRVARELALEGTEHGTCVVAARQTAGRGRLGRTWITTGDALACSIVLHVACPPAHAARITLGAAAGMLAAMDTLPHVDGARVKWPNDIVVPAPPRARVHGRIGPYRKVAGLLVEVVRTAPAPRDDIEVVVVGVGVNVGAPDEGWPEALELTAGALAETGFKGTSDDVLVAVRAHVPDAVGRAVRDLASTLDVLRTRSATLGRRVEVDHVVGVAHDLADDGALVIEDDAGRRHDVRAGDVWLAR